jgi:hypothetical protein
VAGFLARNCFARPSALGVMVPCVLIAGFLMAACTAGEQAPRRPGPSAVSLSCADSAGQQNADSSDRAVNGVASPALTGDTNTYDTLPEWKLSDGHTYFVWKAFIAVSPDARPYRTVTVLTPASAALFYASPSHWGAVSNQPASAPPLRVVRFASCGTREAGYAGGILVRRPGCVRLSVTGPETRATSVTVPVLVAGCGSG